MKLWRLEMRETLIEEDQREMNILLFFSFGFKRKVTKKSNKIVFQWFKCFLDIEIAVI